MYSKQEESLLRKQFWTSFGQYLAPVRSAEGVKINWINYKTGVRFISFKMDVFNGEAYVGIELSNPDLDKQRRFFDQFKFLRPELEETLGEEWIWEEAVNFEGNIMSRIFTTLPKVSINRESDWPQLISFLKTRIILLDKFWLEQKEIFEMLA